MSNRIDDERKLAQESNKERPMETISWEHDKELGSALDEVISTAEKARDSNDPRALLEDVILAALKAKRIAASVNHGQIITPPRKSVGTRGSKSKTFSPLSGGILFVVFVSIANVIGIFLAYLVRRSN